MNIFMQTFNTVLVYPLFNVLLELYHLLGDFGLAIVALTVLVFLATLPSTWKQLTNARRMQALRPQLEEIKRRYPADPAAQLTAQQVLYREHGVSVSSSLVPGIIQMLSLSGLFFALNTALQNATVNGINRLMYPFLAHFSVTPDFSLSWLAALNAAWQIPLGHPDPTHILPILTGIMTFIQMRLAQASTMQGVATQLMHYGQYALLVISVGITVFFAWQLAAGLALYRLAWIVLTLGQRLLMQRFDLLHVTPAGNLPSTSVSTHATLAMTPKPRKNNTRATSAHRRRAKRHKKR